MRCKKSISVCLAFAMILLSSMFFTQSITTAEAATTFTPRLSAPASNNQYYYSSKNIFYAAGYGMPNCTAYAFGRAYEILGSEPKLCHYNAGEWYSYNKNNGYYSYGSTPKLGAIAVWDNYDNDNGHVAVVEKISGTQVTISESAWNGTNFFTETVSTTDSHFGYSRYRFLGFIYIGNFTADSSSNNNNSNSNSNTTPNVTSQTDTYLYRMTSTDGVNLRTGASTGNSVILTIPYNAYLHITTTQSAGGYTWGKTTYNGKSGWCVLNYSSKIGLLGDTNQDGKLTAADATAIDKHVSKKTLLTGVKLKLADVNGVDGVTVQDSLRLKQFVGKYISVLG